ncbi:MAG: glycosyltransferase family 4 protein [Clostridiaceae bacterium]|nr:glycosyltransferase family 4 protein [Clostridiaceae bacterium]
MKVALVCTEKLPVPPILGGAIQIYIEGILPELSKHHEITVFCIKQESLPDEEELNGVRYIRVAGSNKTEYVRNIKLRLDDSYDLIHVFNRPRWVVRLSKALPKTKFSLSLHNEMMHEEKIPRDMGLTCIKRVEFITTVSKFIADGVIKLFPEAEGKIYTVYSGVDVDKFKPVMSEEGIRNKEILKKELGIEDKKVVLFVGRLGEKKGAEKLITAMKSVMDIRSDVALVVIGSRWYGTNTADEYTKSVVALAESLNGPAMFTGYLSHEVMPAYYNLADVFVCPSQWREPLARVHYEAMAAGLPIITTNRGGNKEVVEGYENGIVIDDFSNPDAFSEQILLLLDNPEKASAMGLKGRKLAEEKYSWNRVANDLLTLFRIAEESQQVQPEQPPEVATEDSEASKQVLPEQPSEVATEENGASKQVLPEQPSEASTEENGASEQVLPEQPSEASTEENKAPKQVFDKKTSEMGAEINNNKDFTKEKHAIFRKMIGLRYPGMPDDVVDFLEEFEDYFLRGEL